MREHGLTIPLPLRNTQIELTLFPEGPYDLLIAKEDADDHGEAQYQVMEGCCYEYRLSDGYRLETSEIVSRSKFNPSVGRILPNIYVGTLTIPVLDAHEIECGHLSLEVQSVKLTYREDYRLMLEEITDQCADLLMQHSASVTQKFTADFTANSRTLYQRFAFVKSILDSVEFSDALHKIINAPVTRWKEQHTSKDIRAIKRCSGTTVRQFIAASNRMKVSEDSPLASQFPSVPSKINVGRKIETVDTPENRFVKHALTTFLHFFSEINTKLEASTRIKKEVAIGINKLTEFLDHGLFKEVSLPYTLPLNSPILQRKEGYREVLRTWLMFDLAAKVVWHGGDDVYNANKRDVAVLYEYWAFFKLLRIIAEVFSLPWPMAEKFLEETQDGLGLKLKQGKHLSIEGIFTSGPRKLNIQFSYNKTFYGGQPYPRGGSWTRNLRPDYTLTIWPLGISQDEAETQELITHLHFDAKYKIEGLRNILGTDENLDEEKEEQKKGNYKRADLLKMHTYKDAIRRTAGAYILYPGNEKTFNKSGFHEVIPGLGAFSLRPSHTNDGSEAVKTFLHDVLEHFMNRASQRENYYLKTYNTFRKQYPNILVEPIPETIGKNRNLIPDETHVLVGYYRKENLSWIITNKLYNARTNSTRGSLRLGIGEASAKYLLLHTEGELITNKLFKIVEGGPRVFSKDALIEKGYSPSSTKPSHYLVYQITQVQDIELLGRNWDLRKLELFQTGRNSPLPFAVTLTELMKSIIK